MEPIGCPETSVTDYKSTLRNIPEKGLSRFYRNGSLKSSIIVNASLNRNAKDSEGTHGKPRGDSTAYLSLSRLQCSFYTSLLDTKSERREEAYI